MASNTQAYSSNYSSSQTKILDYLQTCVFLIDSDFRVQYINSSAEALTGISYQRVAGLPMADVFDAPTELQAMCQRAVSTMGSVELRETTIVSLHAPQVSVAVDITAIPAEDGDVVVEIRNIENRLRIKRDKAMESQSSVSRTMIKQLAHEIKNPLGGLRGAAQLLSRRLPTPDLLEYTDIIINETDRLVHLVDAMLGPNRPTHREALNIHRVLDHVGKLISAEAPETVEIVRDFDPSVPHVLIDQDQMKQAILNLARNALQAVGTSGQITFRSRIESGFTLGAERHSAVVRVDVQDSGSGVSAELREKIFYPLVTGRTDGVGLGLAIAQELVKRHEGVLKLQSGQPTIFSIYLPLVDSLDNEIAQ